jgi:fucose permease
VVKTIPITWTIGMIVGFGGTQYLGFVVMLVLFLVVMIGAYWFVLVKPRETAEKPTP